MDDRVVCSYLKFPWRTHLFLCHVADYCESSMIFSFDDSNSQDNDEEAALLISKRGGFILDHYTDDDCTIVLSDSTAGNKSNEQRIFDRFDIKFIQDSVAEGKLQNLNEYLIGESLFHPYNANLILHRRLKWSDIQKKQTPKLLVAAGENPDANNSSNSITRKKLISTVDDQDENENRSKSAEKGNGIKKNATYVKKKISSTIVNKKSENGEKSVAGAKEINYSQSKEKGKKLQTTVSDEDKESSSESSAGEEIISPNLRNASKLNSSKKRKISSSESSSGEERNSPNLRKRAAPSKLKSSNKEKKSSSKSPVGRKTRNSPNLKHKATTSKLNSSKKSVVSYSESSAEKEFNSPNLRPRGSPYQLRSPDKGKESLSKSPILGKARNLSNLGNRETTTELNSSNKEKESSSESSDGEESNSPNLRNKPNSSKKETERPSNKSVKVKTLNLSGLQGTRTPLKTYAHHKCQDRPSKSSAEGKEKNLSYLNEQPTSSKSIAHYQKGTAKSAAKAKENSDWDSEDDDTLFKTTLMMEKGLESVATTKAPNLSNSASKVKAGGPVTSTPLKRSRTTSWVRRVVTVVSSDTDSAEQMPLRQVRKRKSRSNSPPGEPVSDFSVDYSSGEENGNGPNNIGNTSRKTRQAYTQKEKKAIVKFIIDKNLYRFYGGNKMWMYLERSNLVPGRTYQSLKEHFRRQILPNLQNFNFINAKALSDFEEAKKFLRRNPRAAEAPINLDTMEFLH